jgi:hypothetical protein
VESKAFELSEEELKEIETMSAESAAVASEEVAPAISWSEPQHGVMLEG